MDWHHSTNGPHREPERAARSSTLIVRAATELDTNASHAVALLGTFVATVGAMLTVCGLVLATFCRAGFANLSADSADIVGIA
jgi:hypothetical protein